MSNLPELDPLKVSQRANHKLSAQLLEVYLREAQLEILAEALRDERDAARSERYSLKSGQ